MENLTNEELVEKYQESKCDVVFNELYIRNKGLLHSVRLSFGNDKLIDKETINSSCHFGFFRAVKGYEDGHDSKFTTYCHLNMRSEVNTSRSYVLTKSRYHLNKKFVYLDAETMNGEGSKLVNIIDLNNNNTSTNNEYTFLYEAIDYAKTKILDKYHPYIIPLLLKDVSTIEVSELINVDRRTISYSMGRFKSYARKHIESYLKSNKKG